MSVRQIFALLGLACCVACQGTGDRRTSPYSALEGEERQTAKAEELTKKAADLILTDPKTAERLLRDALARDLFFGPAHNNLGVILLNAGDLYGAASEFEWACKLMPGHPDPEVNLGLTLERAGRDGDAMVSYSAALEVYPGYVPALQALARATLMEGRDEPRLREWLETIALQGEDGWRDWASQQLTRLDRP